MILTRLFELFDGGRDVGVCGEARGQLFGGGEGSLQFAIALVGFVDVGDRERLCQCLRRMCGLCFSLRERGLGLRESGFSFCARGLCLCERAP